MSASIDYLSLTTPLGTQPFRLVGLSGGASLSQCFRYTLTLRSGTSALTVNDLLYKPVTVTLFNGGAHQCYLNGLVLSVVQHPSNSVGSALGGSSSFWDYELVMVPTLHFLSQTSDCRFFENLSADAIVTKILGEFDISDYEFNLSASPPVRPYTVMFNETYLDFIDRILAEAGLFYFFEHTDSKHTLVVGNANSVFSTLPASPVLFTSQNAIEAGINAWHQADATAVGEVEWWDYNPATASTAIQGDAPTVLTTSGASLRRHYRWPCFSADSSTAGSIADRHMQAHEVRATMFEGDANIPDLYAGGKFTLKGDPTADGGDTDYIVQTVSLSISDTAGGGGGSAQGSQFSASVVAFPAKTTWQPMFLPKPAMNGLYSATVIGTSGEEIYTDDLGRIKVQFPWDRAGSTTPAGSFWLRVVQPWAGAGWGAQFIPRVGQEVAVAFLEGDVDRPVAIGALYNSTNTPLFPAAQKNKSGFRSRSTKGGGSSDYNEFSFDDTMGSEVVLLHAQYDHTIEVEHDQTMTVGNCRTVTVDKDESITIKGNQTVEVDGNQSETVKGNESETVKGKQSISVTGSQSVKVTQAVTYESDESITLKVGGNSIKIDQTGITLSGTMIKIDAQAQLETSGAIAQHKGSGMLQLQGGIIMVN